MRKRRKLKVKLRKKVREQRIKLFGSFFLLICICFAVGLSFYWGKNKIIAVLMSEKYLIKEPEIVGTEKISHADILSFTRTITYGKSVWLLPAKELRNKIKAEFPRVLDAKIKRDYPNKIKVLISERTPLAITNDDGMPVAIDFYGWQFIPTDEEIEMLPIILSHSEGDIKTASAFINYAASLSQTLLGQINSIKIEGDKITTVMSDASTIIWGQIDNKTNFDYKLQCFEAIFKDAKNRYGGVESIDLTDIKKNKRAVVLPARKKI